MIWLCIAAAVSAQNADVELFLTVETESGQPIVNAPFEAATLVQSAFAMTDSSGQATFDLTLGEGETSVIVRMTHGGFAPLVPPELKDEAISRFHTLRTAHSFKPYYIIGVDGETVNATVNIQDAVTVSGRLVNEDETPRIGLLAVRDRVSFDQVFSHEEGRFSIGGVPRGRAVEVWIGGNTNQMHRIALTAAQTAQNVDIGDVPIADRAANGAATIRMENSDGLTQPSKLLVQDSMGLVKVDDAEPHMFHVDKSGRATWTNAASKQVPLLPVPEGTYYVTPGAYGDRAFFALYEAVKAGRQAQLDAAGVPKITIVAGQTAELTFDAQAAHDAIIEVGGDLVDE